ncbi:MAG: hypothetical protein H7070_10470 [Saprospiraceae bacterium]|nr:hypothetical protein [Pyrinomonadaceae bacterium]
MTLLLKEIVFIVFCLVLCVQGIDGQKSAKKRADMEHLKGKWVISEKESTFGQRENGKSKSYQIDISSVGHEFSIRHRYDYINQPIDKHYSIFADGRGEKNGEVKSKTKWSKNRLIRKFSYKTNFGWTDVTEEYQLSENSNRLVFEYRADSKMSMLQHYSRLVFSRN